MAIKNAFFLIFSLVVLAGIFVAQTDAIDIKLASPSDGFVSSSKTLALSYSASSSLGSDLSCSLNVYQSTQTIMQKSDIVKSGSTQKHTLSLPNGKYAWETICSTSGGVKVSQTRVFEVHSILQENALIGSSLIFVDNTVLLLALVVLIGVLFYIYLSSMNKSKPAEVSGNPAKTSSKKKSKR